MSPQVQGLAHSVQARLKNRARATGRPFAEIIELYAIERFLHRLGRSSEKHTFVLKGAALLRFWLGTETRPTRDIDLAGPADLTMADVREALQNVFETPVEPDAIETDLSSLGVQPIRRTSPILGYRATCQGSLGQIRLRYQIDVGLGDEIFPAPQEIEPTGLLDLRNATVRAYTPYTTVAKKLEAIIVLGLANTRMKDYYDLWKLPLELRFEGSVLVEAIDKTLARRKTRIPLEPDGLTEAFASDPLQHRKWTAFLRRSQLGSHNFEEVVRQIRRFVDPPLDAARLRSDFRRTWLPGGSWAPSPEARSC